MKIRIVGNTIRLRLSQSDVEELRDESRVEEVTEFGLGSDNLRYSLSLSNSVDEPVASFRNNHIIIQIPEYESLNWIDSDEVGLENDNYTHQYEGLKLLLEKDFQCLHERRHEDESDAFPNPLADSNRN